ncbi:hypothetical protein APV28_4741 [Comamonas testosteroni]|nr:hypothetical protein APV28_4741 [Comamonas testosteroni]
MAVIGEAQQGTTIDFHAPELTRPLLPAEHGSAYRGYMAARRPAL